MQRSPTEQIPLPSCTLPPPVGDKWARQPQIPLLYSSLAESSAAPASKMPAKSTICDMVCMVLGPICLSALQFASTIWVSKASNFPTCVTLS